MSYTRKVAQNTAFQIVGKIIVTAISLVTIGYLTRYLGVSGYGIYTTIFVYVAFWAVLADYGFFWVLLRELAKPGAEKDKVFNNVITLKIVFGLVVFGLCSAVGFLIPQYNWGTKIGIAVISASWFWMSLNATYIGLFQSQLEMYKTVISDIIGRVLIFAGVVYLVLAKGDLQAILAVYILGNFFNFFLNYLWGQKYIKLRLAFDWLFWKFILAEGLSLALLSIIGLMHYKIDTIILSLMKGPVDVGIYGVPYKMLDIILIVPAVFIGNVFPILTRYFHSQDERLNQSIQKSFDFLVILAVPIMVWLIVLAWPLVSLIGGQDYLNSSTVTVAGHIISAPRVLMILALSVGVSFVLTIFSNILTVINKQRTQVLPMVIITILNIILNIIFIPRYSYFAAAVITFLTTAVMLFWWYRLAHRHLHFRLNYGNIPRALLAGLAAGLVFYFLIGLNVILVSVLGLLTYFIAGYFLKLYDWQMLKKMIPGGEGRDA